MDTNLPYDIYGLVPYVDYFRIFLIIVGVLLALTFLAFMVKRLILKWHKKESSIPPKTKLELLTDIISGVEKLDPSEDEVRFYELISMLFREGLEVGLGFGATSMTVVELKEYVMNSSFEDEEKIETMQFFKISDLVKFSSHTTDGTQRLEYKTFLLGLLNKIKEWTRIKIQEEEQKKAEGNKTANSSLDGTEEQIRKTSMNDVRRQ